jgi:alcohol dehydrogenase class IV
MISPTLHYLTDVFFEPGIAGQTRAICGQLDVHRPLIVTDSGILELGLTRRLGLESAPVFSDVRPNPTAQDAEAGLAAYREHACDGLVGFGGGSPMDCAKAISLLVTHSDPLESYAMIHGGALKISADKPPVVAVPTTAGTGSEVGRAALISFGAGKKLGIIGNAMIPDAAVCDPELTLALPPLITAATGMDAMSHCVETFCSPRYNPVADAIAMDGLRRAWEFLPRVMSDPGNVEFRSSMMMASTEGALAFQKGLGLIHSLSHPLGSLPDKPLHHGTLNAIFLPHVVRFNGPACREKLQSMAESMDVKPDPDSVADAFQSLIGSLGLPLRLRDIGVTEQDLEILPKAAMRDHSTATNPRKITETDCSEILRQAW